MALWVLRFGHRRFRDQRVSTHVALVARALGARGVIFCGEEDEDLLASVNRVTERWGGPFEAKWEANWRKAVERFQKKGGRFVHLTMYGIMVQTAMKKIRKEAKSKKLDWLVLVGSQKVPIEAYQLADYNVAVTNQPHSEIAALAVFLDRFFEGKELERKWRAKIRITPSEIGKRVVSWKKNGRV